MQNLVKILLAFNASLLIVIFGFSHLIVDAGKNTERRLLDVQNSKDLSQLQDRAAVHVQILAQTVSSAKVIIFSGMLVSVVTGQIKTSHLRALQNQPV